MWRIGFEFAPGLVAVGVCTIPRALPRNHFFTLPVLNVSSSDWDGAKNTDTPPVPPSRHQREDSLFTPQELARIKSQFEKSIGSTTDEE